MLTALQQTACCSPLSTGRNQVFEKYGIGNLIMSSSDNSEKLKEKEEERIKLSYLFRSPAYKIEITALT